MIDLESKTFDPTKSYAGMVYSKTVEAHAMINAQIASMIPEQYQSCLTYFDLPVDARYTPDGGLAWRYDPLPTKGDN